MGRVKGVLPVVIAGHHGEMLNHVVILRAEKDRMLTNTWVYASRSVRVFHGWHSGIDTFIGSQWTLGEYGLM